MLILSKSGHKSRAAIARPIESSRPIETAYRSQPDPKSAARWPEKNEVVRHRQKETRERGAPGGRRDTKLTPSDPTQVPIDPRNRLPQARPRSFKDVREPLPIRRRPGRARF